MNTTKNRRTHERSVGVVVKPSEGQPDLLIRITQDGKPSSYWASRIVTDWAEGWRLEKPGYEGDESYDVLLDAGGDSCTCPGHTYHGYCKHVDALRALRAAGRLPLPILLNRAAGENYKPGHS